MPLLVFDIIGWIGMISILSAYFLLSSNYYTKDSVGYHLINLVGGICLGLGALSKETYYVVVLEIIWTSIALISLYKIFTIQKKKNKESSQSIANSA